LVLEEFFNLAINKSSIDMKYEKIFNDKIKDHWENIFKFILFHYFTNNPKNEYWQHYKLIQNNDIFDFYEKYIVNEKTFSKPGYFSVSLGLKIKDFYYSFPEENYFQKTLNDYLTYNHSIDCENLLSHRQVLDFINENYKEDKIITSVKPKKNKAVLFDGKIFHSSSKPIENSRRVVLNINLENETK
jgi:hypothetical protein